MERKGKSMVERTEDNFSNPNGEGSRSGGSHLFDFGVTSSEVSSLGERLGHFKAA